MVRQFAQGSYEDLKKNLDNWYADLQLRNPRRHREFETGKAGSPVDTPVKVPEFR